MIFVTDRVRIMLVSKVITKAKVVTHINMDTRSLSAMHLGTCRHFQQGSMSRRTHSFLVIVAALRNVLLIKSTIATRTSTRKVLNFPFKAHKNTRMVL